MQACANRWNAGNYSAAQAEWHHAERQFVGAGYRKPPELRQSWTEHGSSGCEVLFAVGGPGGGGPLNIPKIYNGGGKTFFFVGWNGRRGSSPYDAFSTVPTAAERTGDFSALAAPIYDPATGQQFQFNGQPNVMDPSLITAQAQALLNYIPLPNLPGATQNFHFVTSAESNADSVSLRRRHNQEAVRRRQRWARQRRRRRRRRSPKRRASPSTF